MKGQQDPHVTFRWSLILKKKKKKGRTPTQKFDPFLFYCHCDCQHTQKCTYSVPIIYCESTQQQFQKVLILVKLLPKLLKCIIGFFGFCWLSSKHRIRESRNDYWICALSFDITSHCAVCHFFSLDKTKLVHQSLVSYNTPTAISKLLLYSFGFYLI